MRYFQKLFTAAGLLFTLTLLAGTPAADATGWDKCPQSATITLDRHVIKGSHIRRSALRRLLPAVLVTGQTYDFVVVCPAPTGPGMDMDTARDTDSDAAPAQVRFYQEAAAADQPKGQIVLMPFRAPQRSVVIMPTVAGMKNKFVPVSFSEQALGGAHEQKIVAAVSIKGEKALLTFVLISASFYHRELRTMRGHR